MKQVNFTLADFDHFPRFPSLSCTSERGVVNVVEQYMYKRPENVAIHANDSSY